MKTTPEQFASLEPQQAAVVMALEELADKVRQLPVYRMCAEDVARFIENEAQQRAQ